MEEVEAKKVENELGTEKISKLIKKFSIPCIMSLLVSALYNIVDQIFIGQGVGYLGNAATNIVYPITVIATAFAVLIGDGAAAYLSLSLGKKDEKEASKGVNNAIVLAIIAGIVFLILGIIFKDGLLKVFGVTEAVYDYASQYMFWIVIGLPFFIFTTAMNSIIRADGSPKYAMITMLIGAILNIILDPIAIFGLKMGVTGAAIATIIGQIVSGTVSFVYIFKLKSVKVEKEYLKLEWKTVKKVASLGISSFITQIAITVLIITMNQQITKYGASSKYGSEIPLSALGIVMKVNTILISISVGIAAGAQPIIGFNYGAENYKRVREALTIAIKTTVCILIVFFLVFQLYPQVIISIFGQENELYNEFAKLCFRVYLMFCVLNGVQIISSIFFQAIGKPAKSALLSLSRQILLAVPAILILPTFWGVEGILWAGPVADGIAFILAITLLSIETSKIRKMETKEEKKEVVYNG